MDYEKIIKSLIQHFADMEGTDYLGMRGDLAPVDGLSKAERLELTRLRDEARQAAGWDGYGD